MAIIKVVQFINHDNPFSLLLEKEVDDVTTPVNFISTGVSRMVIVYGSGQIDSDIEGEGSGINNVFDWTTNGTNGIVTFNLGTLTVPVSTGTYTCDLVVYDPTYDDGQVWEKAFKLYVKPQKVT